MRSRATRLGACGVAAPPTRFTSAGYLTSTPVIIAANADIRRFARVMYAIMNGASIGNNSGCEVFWPNWTSETTLEFQLQINDGLAKCVKVLLAQSGQNIVGSVQYARWRAVSGYGMNADAGGWNTSSISTGDGIGGYGCKEICLGVRG